MISGFSVLQDRPLFYYLLQSDLPWRITDIHAHTFSTVIVLCSLSFPDFALALLALVYLLFSLHLATYWRILKKIPTSFWYQSLWNEISYAVLLQQPEVAENDCVQCAFLKHYCWHYALYSPSSLLCQSSPPSFTSQNMPAKVQPATYFGL